MKYPVILQLQERHVDDWFYICNDSDELKRASLDAFDGLQGRLYEEEPEEDRYPEISDEQIENAPTDLIKNELKKLRKRRERWMKGNIWGNSYVRAKRLYDYYNKAKDGDGSSAYHYLMEREYLKVRYPEEI